jgi:hypothetical protein
MIPSMRRSRFAFSLAILAACRAPHAGSAAPAATASDSVVVLGNGLNAADLLGDGTRAQVFVAHRSNYNAHSGTTATFYVFATSDLSDSRIWQIVPFFGGPRDGTTGNESFRTAEGADCILDDMRLIRHHGAPAEVVMATRELGQSFADPANVKFLYYRLVRNSDERVGWPTFYFQYDKTIAASRTYCDVNEAFRRELGLGSVGLGRAEGGR